MLVKLIAFAGSDTLQIMFWTDTGRELEEWFLLLKDTTNVLLNK